MSLVGLPDCDPTEGDPYSMVHAFYKHRKRLAAQRTGGAQLIAELKTEYPVEGTKKKLWLYPGAGALMSTRVLTYLEGASLFDGVVKPYLGTYVTGLATRSLPSLSPGSLASPKRSLTTRR